MFAVRLPTFRAPTSTRTFYIGSNDPDELEDLRRAILTRFQALPISAEYIHRDAYRIAARYGKDVFLAIQLLGTKRLGSLARVKAAADRIGRRLGMAGSIADRLLQRLAGMLPDHLPTRMNAFHARYEHHLILATADDGIAEAQALLAGTFPSATGDMFACTPDEAVKAARHRFAVAGAAVRYREVHRDRVEDIVALDVALRRNDRDWHERLDASEAAAVPLALYYGHFLCHVFHRDYIVAKGVDPAAVEHRLIAAAERAGAKLPAEHNVGHLYAAPPALCDHYRALDPTNRFNPGIGKTSKRPFWS